GTPAPVSHLLLLDTVMPTQPLSGAEVMVGDISDPAVLQRALGDGIDSVFHLAAVVSAAAEADFDLGMRVNLDGTRNLLDACRTLSQPPRFVFASSIAVFGLAPPVVEDDTLPTPQSSYGTQKAMCELLLEDCSRRGFVDGRALRLPTIVVRPGRPNKAASSFASSILREPLAGELANCPVPPEQKLWIMSPDRVIEALRHGHDLPADAFGTRRTLNLPGLTVSVGEMAGALERNGGNPELIQWRRDPDIERMVASWPAAMAARRATELGFTADASIDEIVQAHLKAVSGKTNLSR
ncbi:MAG: D-erythronate dehydrogenase, partial [Alphaproteobacteria bacterium]